MSDVVLDLDTLKRMIRESDVQYFSDAELQAYFDECDEDLQKTAYRCLVIKAQDTTLSVSGLSTSDTSKYFLRLARMYKPHNTCTLGG